MKIRLRLRQQPKRLIQLIISAILYIGVAAPVCAQWVREDVRRLDTLSFRERVNVHVNAADWLALVPNIGVEYDVANNRNYNRWTVSADVRYKWHTSHTFVPNFIYNIFEIKGEFRNYWRTRLIDGNGVQAHSKIWDKAMSQRRYQQKHPLTTYYRGVYLSYATFSLCLGKNALGREGSAIMTGVTYGFIRPLYRFRNGRSLDLDLGVSVGIAFANYHGYYIDKENNRFHQKGKDTGWRFMKFPVVNDIRAGFIYRLGKKQGFQKYNFRYDVDRDYSYRVDSLRSERVMKAYRDSISSSQFQTVYKYYHQQLDSIVKASPQVSKSRLRQEQIHQNKENRVSNSGANESPNKKGKKGKRKEVKKKVASEAEATDSALHQSQPDGQADENVRRTEEQVFREESSSEQSSVPFTPERSEEPQVSERTEEEPLAPEATGEQSTVPFTPERSEEPLASETTAEKPEEGKEDVNE